MKLLLPARIGILLASTFAAQIVVIYGGTPGRDLRRTGGLSLR